MPLLFHVTGCAAPKRELNLLSVSAIKTYCPPPRELDLGLISKVEALRRLHPEIETEEEAMARLLKLRSIERELEELESMAQGQAETNTPESEGT